MQIYTATTFDRGLYLADYAGMPEGGYHFGTFKVDKFTEKPKRIEHLSSLQLQWLQLRGHPIAAVRFSYDNIPDPAAGTVVRQVEVRTCISVSELRSIPSLLTKYSNVEIDTVVISPLYRDVIYLTVPNYSKRMTSAKMGARDFHRANAYSSQCKELGVRVANLTTEEHEDALKGAESFDPVGSNCTMPGMDLEVVIPYGSTIYD
tara:strand:+ start:16529 stop:17143 length:615 start_codon:yes stop_codon:yes gene_type:complete